MLLLNRGQGVRNASPPPIPTSRASTQGSWNRDQEKEKLLPWACQYRGNLLPKVNYHEP